MKTTYSTLPLIALLFIWGIFSCKSDTKPTDNSNDNSQIAAVENNSTPKDTSAQKNLHESTGEQNDSSQTANIETEIASTTESTESQTTTEQAPTQRVVRKKPKIEFEELTWDFGRITEGDIVEKKFKFTNTGNAPLEIKAAEVTCGCTRPTIPFLDIAPGESNVIGVKYNSVGKDGLQNPTVTIESNTNPRTTTLKLTGFVMPKTE